MHIEFKNIKPVLRDYFLRFQDEQCINENYLVARLIHENEEKLGKNIDELIEERFADPCTPFYSRDIALMYIFSNFEDNSGCIFFDKKYEHSVRKILSFKDIKLEIDNNIPRPINAKEIYNRISKIKRIRDLPLSYN